MSTKKVTKSTMTNEAKAVTAATVAGVAVGAVSLAAAASYVVAKKLTKIALDRETPKAAKGAEKMISGTSFDKEFLSTMVDSAEGLLQKEHETVEITSHDGTKLMGHWFKHENEKRIIIAMHGWRTTWNKDFGMIADFWFNNDCSVLFVEQRGQNNSGGDYMGFGLIERYDCLDWIEWVNERTGGNTPIYLGGVSMGAATVLMAAGLELPENVKGIIADCGFTSPHDIWKHVANNNLHMTYGFKGVVADKLCRQKIQIGSDEYSTIDALSKTNIPVMLIHGTDDHFVPVEMSYRNYRACNGPKRLLIVPGADHGMSYYIEKDRYEYEVKQFWKDFC